MLFRSCIANISQSAESGADSIAESAESNADSTAESAESNAKSVAESGADSTADSTESADSTKLSKILRPLSLASIAITAYFLISFANIYGNALKKQDEYLSFRAEMLLQYLGEKIPRGATINLKNHLGFHAVTERFFAKYGETRLVKDVKEYYYHFYSRLQHLNAPYNLNDSDICDFISENFGVELVAQNAWHRIEKAKVCYIVTLK